MEIRRIKRALVLTIISGEPTSGFRHVFGSENVREYCLGDKRDRGVIKSVVQADIVREAKAFKPDWIWMQVQNAWTPSFKVPDVVLCGNYWPDAGFPDYDDRRQAVLALVKAGVDVGVVGRGWPSDVPCVGECPRLHQRAVYRRAKVALNVNNFNGVELYYSRRLLIAMASGIPVVTAYVPSLEKEFGQRKHLLWYKTPDELVAHVKSLLIDDGARSVYASNAGALVRSEHLWRNRVVALLPESEEIWNFGWRDM